MTLPNLSRKKTRKSTRFVRVSLTILLLYFLPLGCKLAEHYSGNSQRLGWWELRRDSSKQAPSPAEFNDAVIQVYAARAARWRGAFGVHTWIAVKPSGADHYTRIEVIGYALRWGGETVRIRQGRPDGFWYGSHPHLLRTITGGEAVDAIIERLYTAAENYPYAKEYNVWPGPNSNTFVAWLARAVPELQLDLPPTAIGKDYLPRWQPVNVAPSGLGVLFSVKGFAGLMLSLEEGIEVNLAGLTLGLDVYPPAIKLPGIGRVGFADSKKFEYADL